MTNFLFAFNALTPLLLLALLGYFLRYKNIVSEEFISYLHKYVFYIALPVLIFRTIVNLGDITELEWNVVWFTVGMIVIITLLGLFSLLLIKMEKHHKPVVLQGIFRGNYVLIGIPLVIRFGGVEALSMMIVLNVFLITINNLFSIATFQLWKDTKGISWKKVGMLLTSTLKNPLMIAVFIAFVFLMFPSIWDFIDVHVLIVPDTLNMISITATPMALIAIGGQFKMTRVKALTIPLIVGITGRMIAVPAIAFTSAYFLRNIINFNNSWAAMIAVFASPIAISSVAVTKGLKGDEELASQLVLWTTAFATISLFILAIVFSYLGLL